ncbi:MAG TPA: VWA domain-containing protein [Desulfobulbaceae bacterium]|nr:VWA domain-containing protein [Desulfobulbaceae bacterium]
MKHLCTFALILLTFSLAANSVTAAKPLNYPEVMFILDCSGSMWGKVGRETKMDAAKKVLHQVLPSLPDEVRVGLTAYGLNRKGDCSDIEILIPPGSRHRKALLAKADAISPKGMTPIADSISKVTGLLKGKENETTIILISDGKETCNKRPCEAVGKLKESGIKFILDVVGFDVNPEEKAQLECLAEAGGGKYFSADSTGDLLSALETVKKAVVQKVETVKAKTVSKKAATLFGKLHITMPPESTKCLATIKIIRAADDKVVQSIKHPPADSVHPLLKGKYKIVAGYANSNFQPDSEALLDELEIKGGETTELSFGALAISIADELKKIPADSIYITNEKNPAFHFRNRANGNNFYFFKTKPVPPGLYSLALTYGTFTWHMDKEPIVLAKDIKVTAGKVSAIAINTGIRIKKPSQAKIKAWELIPVKGKQPLLKIEGWSNDYPVYVPYAVFPGIYDISVYIEGMNGAVPIGQGIEINKGEFV